MPVVAVIGSGFSGLSTAAYLAKHGYTVNLYEKHGTPGGRARSFKTANGYTFDMGPSWYWMPGVFERFFNDFGYKVSDLYDLQLLDPSFEIVFPDSKITVPADYRALQQVFENIEPGTASKLDQFMEEAKYKYQAGIEKLVYKPGLSLFEFAETDIIKNLFRLQVFSSFSKHVARHFSDQRLKSLMEFPVLFLGAQPSATPALYSLMNYAGLKLGTWYPKGGFGKVIEAMVQVAKQQGVNFFFNANVERICIERDETTAVVVNGETFQCDAVVSTADYHHTEAKLLNAEHRNYKEAYWSNKVFAPSCLIYYIGLKTRLPQLQHHTLFFEDLDEHAKDIYQDPRWPDKPCFYVCCPSRTDESVAPPECENLFFLMPLAPGLKDEEATREKYFQLILQKVAQHCSADNLESAIEYKRSYCVSDFIQDYNAYKGNAYGLANTLRQTAILKPKIINKKIRNLMYAGQLTVPGPGVPPSLISGKIVSDQLHKYFKRRKHEAIV